MKDRARFFDIARGSSFECAAIQDVLVATGGWDDSTSHDLKSKLKRVVSMLTRMAMKFDGVGESSVTACNFSCIGTRLMAKSNTPGNDSQNDLPKGAFFPDQPPLRQLWS